MTPKPPTSSAPCSGMGPTPSTRRELLFRTAGGLGGVALSALLAQDQAAAGNSAPVFHHAPRARRVIQIFLCGGVSHLETFDYKPDLIKYDGKPLEGKGPVDTFFQQPGNLMRPQWEFRRRGQSGIWVSDLLPHLTQCTDLLTVFQSMYSKNNNHTPATFFFNSGFTSNGYPTIGAWLSYGLGSENADLPAFVVLPDPRQFPAGGASNWSSGFLPANHQGVVLRSQGDPIPDLFPARRVEPETEAATRRVLSDLNQDLQQRSGDEDLLRARIRSYELAARMQLSVPNIVRTDREPADTAALYGLDDPLCAPFARNCLLARRLVENGVRFVQLFHGGAFGAPRINWDAHEDIRSNHAQEARIMDRPVAGLLRDLQRRGMLDDTLLVWSTEFGRTPITQGLNKPGRDHHNHGFTCWMAGAGLRPGYVHGATDEVGYKAAVDPVGVHDFQATLLHLVGLDHRRLTYYHNGIRRRLTDVEGEVVRGVLSG